MRQLQMKICWMTLFCLTCVMPSFVFAAEAITSVSIEGNRYIETAAIMNKIQVQAGDALDRRQISRDVRRLYATGFFSDIHAEGEHTPKGIKLTYVVVENPVIASVKVEGYDKVSKKKILPLLKLKAGRVLSPRLVREDINTIRRIYLKKGFYQAQAEVQTTMLDDGRVAVHVLITEGDITRIKEIQFVGNHHFTDEVLLDKLATRASGLGSWFTDSDVFNQQRFGADEQKVIQHYLEHGYLDINIESLHLMLTPNMDDFYLSMSIHEGEAYTVTGVELQGDLIPSKEALTKEIKLEVGEVYALSKIQETLQAVSEKVGDEGYAFVNVTPSFHRNIKDHTVVVVLDIEKGREVYVDRIQITGDDKTKDHVIRREFRQHEGERYKASAIRRSQERVQRLSFMKKVSIAKSTTENPRKINLDVNVEESKSGKFSAGISYSQTYGVGLTGSVSEQNLFGEGYQTSLSLDVGGASNTYSLNLRDPYFFRDGVSGSLSVFRNENNLQSFVSYKYLTQGGSAGLGFELNEYVRYGVSYKITNTTLSGVPATASLALRSQEGQATTGELTQSLSYDTRNRTFQPSTGGIQSISFGFAGLTGDRKFYETVLSSKNYFELTDFWTLRATLQLGSIQGYGGLEVPIYRRYSLGGLGTVRGYDSFGISLVDPASLDILGGQHKLISSLDFIFPLPFMETAGFRGTFFLDAGEVWGNSGSVTEQASVANLRGSYGFGIEWASPVGPLTFTWGVPVRRQTYDKVRKFELNLGQSF